MQRFVQIHWTQRKGYCECIFRRNCTGTGQLDSLKNVLKSPLGHNENIFTWPQMVYLWPSLLWNTHANGSFLKLFQCINLSKCPFGTYFVDNIRYVFRYIIPGRVQSDSAQIFLTYSYSAMNTHLHDSRCLTDKNTFLWDSFWNSVNLHIRYFKTYISQIKKYILAAKFHMDGNKWGIDPKR